MILLPEMNLLMLKLCENGVTEYCEGIKSFNKFKREKILKFWQSILKFSKNSEKTIVFDVSSIAGRPTK